MGVGEMMISILEGLNWRLLAMQMELFSIYC